MKILRKIYKDDKPLYQVETDLGLIINVTVSDHMSKNEINEVINLVAQDADNRLKDSIE
ncbi:hypothetical protein [Staphylococcus gallinarum]|uniref:Protein VraX n=1 Tax=Staphylococcus gallinarum TaxID=1293 RepID=A0A380FE87_STAGA|nr:hypothetical protein [Staphylococcus gallinarum]GEQ04514.1 hypothetical protein SGA02_03420 [Staphylococcus gallinarum]SUM32060.1 Uncharacterised protein [Staphylococcus gallinarum]